MSKQVWKVNDEKANKSGPHYSVYWVRNNDKFLENKRMGISVDGVSRFCTGDSYKGYWNNNLKDGYGSQVWSNGNKYEGEWKEGKRHGKGTSWINMHKKLRKEYTGDWVRDKKEGLGIYYYENGNRYEGEWKDGKRHGRGKMTYINGDLYEGDWKDDERSGPGILISENGNRYEGQWLSDKKEGPGRYYYRNTGKLYIGEWAEDTPKCGTYSDLPPHLLQDRAIPPPNPDDHFQLPTLGLQDTNEVLINAMTDVRRERQSARAPVVELEDVFSNEELGQLGEAWLSMDEKDTGSIKAIELVTVLAGLGITPSEEEMEVIFGSLGVERSGSVTWEMFINLMAELKTT